MAAWAASLTGSGTSKSGWPMLRLIGSGMLRASSNTLRMPDDSMKRILSAIQWVDMVRCLGQGAERDTLRPRQGAGIRGREGRSLAGQRREGDTGGQWGCGVHGLLRGVL